MKTKLSTPISDSLKGILRKAAGNKSYDKLKAEATKNKYGLSKLPSSKNFLSIISKQL